MPNSEDRCQCRMIHEERVDGARQKALAAEEIENLAQLFKALADPNRLRIIFALEQDEMCVCDLAAFLEVTESAVSHQLRLLRQLNFVTNRRQGPILYYRLTDSHISRLAGLALDHLRE
ncbi:MAG: metalloregulator ArsR/SmtB family transcription factor [Desulfobulbaceae bacterium]|nr:metalloregulator ArsR/SmtB family transcription factor [Desulfobulbaceae bacterium]